MQHDKANNLIYRFLIKYLEGLKTLPTIKIGKDNICYPEISLFAQTSKLPASCHRNQNDLNNKKRELIINLIINNQIPQDYYIKSRCWYRLRDRLHQYIDDLHLSVSSKNKNTNGICYDKLVCKQKGGRGHHHDFILEFYYPDDIMLQAKVEFKYGSNKVNNCPQFVSPMKPSQYLSNHFELDFYQQVLPQICSAQGVDIPPLEVYQKQIHNDKPECMLSIQQAYYRGAKQSSKFTGEQKDIEFYQLCNRLSKQHIQQFITQTDLSVDQLNSYIRGTQKDKYYMLYHNNQFHLEVVHPDCYQIETVKKNPNRFRYECETINGNRLNILLRWKNGNGVAFPAFQIS